MNDFPARGCLLALLLVAACRDQLLQPGSVPFDPPRAYAVLWAEVESCSALRGDWRRVTWYRSPSLPADWVAMWVPPHNVVPSDALFSGDMSEWYRDFVVRHEILHDLEQRDDHPIVFQT